MNQHAPPREVEIRDLQDLPGRHCGDRNSRRLHVGQTFGRLDEFLGIDEQLVGIGAALTERGHNAIAAHHARDTGSRLQHDAGHFDTKGGRQLQLEAIADMAIADLPVEAVHSGSSDLDQDLTWTRIRYGYWINREGFGAAIDVKT